MRPSWLACPTRTKPSTLTKRRQWRLRGQDSTRCFCASRSALINESMILLEDHKCVQGHMQGQESRELFALPQKLADASRCVCCFRVLSSRQCMITKLFGPVLQLARLASSATCKACRLFAARPLVSEHQCCQRIAACLRR